MIKYDMYDIDNVKYICHYQGYYYIEDVKEYVKEYIIVYKLSYEITYLLTYINLCIILFIC